MARARRPSSSGAATTPARLSALDASYITLERHGLPMNVGGFVVLGQPADVPPLTLGRLRTRMAARAVALSRLRQRLYEVPLDLARPVWGDDPDFTVEHHVRELTLPLPGGRRELERLAERLHGEPMELGRPLCLRRSLTTDQASWAMDTIRLAAPILTPTMASGS